MPKIPDRLSIEKNDKEKYEKLREESIFKEKDNKDLFIFAMAYGYTKNVCKTLESKEGYVRTEYLKSEDWALIDSLVIDKGSIDMLGNPEKIFQLAEQYANAGIKLLNEKINSIQFGSFDKYLEKDEFELYNKIMADKK